MGFLFELKQCGKERSDCTAPYDVVFNYKNRHPTVKNFLEYITKTRNNDWGYLYISPSSAYKDIWSLIRYNGTLESITYSRGLWDKNYDIFIEKYGKQKIKSATADGGWSRMDYVLLLETC